jgi:uncharacterized protein YfaS (alpha-2-macroglobulin family)
MLRRPACFVVLALVAGSAPWASGSAAAASRQAACVAKITRFEFRPSTAAEGSAVVLRLAVQNCTGRTQHLALTRFATEPPGCPVIDPLRKAVTIKPRSTYRERTPMTAPPCAGTMQITERVTDTSGKQLSGATAVLTVTS